MLKFEVIIRLLPSKLVNAILLTILTISPIWGKNLSIMVGLALVTFHYLYNVYQCLLNLIC